MLYDYVLLNNPDYYHWTRTSGVNGCIYNSIILYTQQFSFEEGETVDIPYATLKGLHPYLAAGKKNFIVPYTLEWETFSNQARTYKTGIDKSLFFLFNKIKEYYYDEEYCNTANNGNVIRVVPKIKSGDTFVIKEPFYVTDHGILNKNKEYIMGVFLRVRYAVENNTPIIVPEKCIVKVDKKVFIEPSAPIHKIVLKDMLPLLLRGKFVFETNNIPLFHVGGPYLSVSMETIETNINQTVPNIENVEAKEISETALKFFDNIGTFKKG